MRYPEDWREFVTVSLLVILEVVAVVAIVAAAVLLFKLLM